MKKLLLIVAAMALSSAAWSQNHAITVYEGGMPVFMKTTSEMDSVKFGTNNANFFAGSTSWSRGILEIDSILFSNISTGDTSVFADTTVVDLSNAILIHWSNDSTVSITNPYLSDGVNITAQGGHVTVESAAGLSELVYSLSGNSSNGSLSVTTDKKFILYLNGVNLGNPNGAAIKIVSDKKGIIHTAYGTTNFLTDGNGSAEKGALQSKGKIELQGSGVLNVTGVAKHGIQTSGSTSMLAGTVNVLSAKKDGMNVDCFVMEGGNINISNSDDGIDGDQGYVLINGGNINISLQGSSSAITCDSTLTINGGHFSLTLTGDDAKGLKSKQSVAINGGNLEIETSGNISKGIKATGNVVITGGNLEITASGSTLLTEAGQGYEASYCTGIKADGDLSILNGIVTINCPATNEGGKGISTDGNVNLAGGLLTITAEGPCGTYTNEEGVVDDYSPTAIKSDKNIYVSQGVMELAATGKALSADSNITITGGELTLSTNGNGAITIGGTGTSAVDGYSSACIKADGNLNIQGGKIQAISTGKGGRGFVANKLTVGTLNAPDSLIRIYIKTSGQPVNASSGGGWGGPGGPGGGSSDYWKGLPKGIKIQDTLVFNSGMVGVYCSQTSGDPNGEAIESKTAIIINGGEIEANSYDDAINAGTYLEINGGRVWANARGNDGIDCNGANTVVNGGVVIVKGSEVGFDASTDAGGHFTLNGGVIVSVGGNMGAWDNPNGNNTQKYLTLNVTATNGFCVKNSNGDEIMVFKMPNISGDGFENNYGTGTKPPGGGGGSNSGRVAISCPEILAGTYQVFSSVSIEGGECWHGLYEGATCTTSGTATSVTAH